MFILYEIFLFFLCLLLLPFSLWQGKGDVVWQRLFFSYPEIKEERPVVWVHAVSFGEVKAVHRLLKEYVEKQEQKPYIIVSTVTKTGLEEAKKSLFFADQHLYLPLDFQWNLKRALPDINLKKVILVEGDHWPGFLFWAKNKGAEITVVNGKISEKSTRYLQKVPFVAQWLFGFVDRWLVQTKKYAERLEKLKIDPSIISVTGNIKYDAHFPRMDEQEEKHFREKLGITSKNFVITIGSTHEPEEFEIIQQLKPLLDKDCNCKVILVPRHPERFAAVPRILQKMGIASDRYTQKAHCRSQVVVVDAMGVLCKCYQISDVAIVAGSFTDRIGGHNLLEPAAYAVPSLFGPYTFTQKQMQELLLDSGGGRQVILEDLQEAVETAGKDQEMGVKGQALLRSLNGSVKRTLSYL